MSDPEEEGNDGGRPSPPPNREMREKLGDSKPRKKDSPSDRDGRDEKKDSE